MVVINAAQEMRNPRPEHGEAPGMPLAERKSLLAQALADLPLLMQQVAVLHYTEGLSQYEIGIVLNMPESCVRGIWKEALDQLREKLASAKADLASCRANEMTDT